MVKDSRDEQFLPETVDEQVEALLQRPADQYGGTQINVQLVHELYSVSQENARILAGAWDHIDTYQKASQTTLAGQSEGQEMRRQPFERTRHMQQPMPDFSARRATSKYGSLLVATILILLLVSSMLAAFAVFNAQRNQSATPPPAGLQPSSVPPRISSRVYMVDGSSAYKLDAQTGRTIWSTRLHPLPGATIADPFYAFALTLSGKMVYVVSENDSLYALNATSGKLLWGKVLPDDPNIQPAILGPATVVGGLVYTSTHSGTYALDTATGQQFRSYPANLMYAAAVEQNTLYYINNNIHKLSAVDLQSGQIRWQTPLSRNAITGPIHLMNGTISMTMTSYETEKATNSFVSAFDAATGKSLWQSAPIHYPILDCTVTQNAIYFGAPRSAVYALDVHTGQQLWQSPNIDFAGVAPQADGSLVYATVHEWEPPMFPWTGTQIVAIHVGNGSIAWHYTGRSQNINSMIVHLGVLYVSYGQAGLDVLNAQRSIIWHLPQGATYNSGANGLEAIP